MCAHNCKGFPSDALNYAMVAKHYDIYAWTSWEKMTTRISMFFLFFNIFLPKNDRMTNLVIYLRRHSK
ncbi:hypothetical protein Bcoa_2039 [Heyndrickxia coagulans 36D1]|uniref:Uncharacterized protein n=1 Tax=Heyndrickxia coagulans 36D1 TaxID=345219 RepID=G2TN00_HEYCO|nr:hypothetical protein Bcoa_2039 [Heyndrickxia coagulans 36D1]